jgi:hypothetical protein
MLRETPSGIEHTPVFVLGAHRRNIANDARNLGWPAPAPVLANGGQIRTNSRRAPSSPVHGWAGAVAALECAHLLPRPRASRQR